MRVWLSVVLLTGCSTGLELSVDLRSDLRPGFEVDEAVVTWERAGQTLGQQSVSISAGDDLARGRRLIDILDLAPGAHLVHVILRLAGVDVADRSRAFELDGDLAITIVITRQCRDDSCTLATCVSDADCASVVDCVQPACVGQVCLAVPDDALCEGRCDPVMGCVDGGPIDAGPRDDAGPDVDGGPPPDDAGPPCPSLGCGDPSCEGLVCDDGDPCTHGDRCSMGACVGTAVTCSSDSCVTRTCNGTPTCTVAAAMDGTACDDDANACTNDVCGGGACLHEALADGTAISGFTLCCSGSAVDTSTDRGNCGGCGLACATGFPCVIDTGQPTCDCATANADCHGGRPSFVCSSSWGVCACLPGGCPGTSTCISRSGPDYCEY